MLRARTAYQNKLNNDHGVDPNQNINEQEEEKY